MTEITILSFEWRKEFLSVIHLTSVIKSKNNYNQTNKENKWWNNMIKICLLFFLKNKISDL